MRLLAFVFAGFLTVISAPARADLLPITLDKLVTESHHIVRVTYLTTLEKNKFKVVVKKQYKGHLAKDDMLCKHPLDASNVDVPKFKQGSISAILFLFKNDGCLYAVNGYAGIATVNKGNVSAAIDGLPLSVPLRKFEEMLAAVKLQ